MALVYCNDCQTSHLPDQHGQIRPRRSGGRHLAPRKKRKPFERAREVVANIDIPAAEELGERTSSLLRWVGNASQSLGQNAQRAAGQAIAAAPGLIRSTWATAVDFSGMLNPPSRHARPNRAPVIESDQADRARRSAVNVSSIGVGVTEYAHLREPLMEVSMLESLGFYDPDNTVVVQVSNPTRAPAAAPWEPAPPNYLVNHQVLPDPLPPLPSQGAKAPLIPDLELEGWKPHVIARSKLGSRSFRLTSVGVAALIGISAIILIVGSVRQPRSEAIRIEAALEAEARSLASSLGALETALAAANAAQIEATAPLAAVETSARGLFEVASQMDGGDNSELRPLTTDLSRQSLDLKNRVTEALSYRVVLGSFWQTPDLSGITDPAEAAAALAPWQAHITELVAALPATVELNEHAEAVEKFAGEVPQWAQAYLDALTEADLATAEQQLVVLEASLAQLAQAEDNTITGVIEGARNQGAAIIDELTQLIAGLQSP